MSEEERKDRLLARMTDAGGRIRIRNAMHPILWLCGLVGFPSIIVLGWSSDPPVIIPILLCFVIIAAVIAFFFLLFFDRDRLQSEEYLIRKQTLELIEEKGSKKAIDAATVQAISQSEFLVLDVDEKGSEDEK